MEALLYYCLFLHSYSNRNSRDLDMTDTSYPHRSHKEEERFPEHLFAELMRFDSVEEEEAHNQAAQTEAVMSSPEKSSRAESHNYNSQSSSTVYKTSHSSELAAKFAVSGKSIVLSGQLPSTDSSERGIADGKSVDMKDYGNDEILSDGPYSTGKHAKLQKPPKRLRQEGKSLDSGLHNESIKSREIIRMYTGRKRSQDSSISHDIRLATAAISMMTDSKGRRSRGSMSYDSISSNCSSTRGELVRAYEFGKKCRLQEYHIPHVAMDSTTEESCSEWDDLCEFSSLPRDSNDCHVHMPIPVKCKDVLKPYLNGNIPVMSLQDPYDGESLV